jgi:hypothetical protein
MLRLFFCATLKSESEIWLIKLSEQILFDIENAANPLIKRD